MDTFKTIFFKTSLLMEAIAVISFTTYGIYAVTAFIAAKWILAAVFYFFNKVFLGKTRLD